MELRTITVVPWAGATGWGARASARSIAQHKRSENEGGRRNPVKSGASVRSSRVGFASIAPFRARRDRGRLPPTTGPVCQGWAIPSWARCYRDDYIYLMTGVLQIAAEFVASPKSLLCAANCTAFQ
jgi:hypothetical protein